MTRRDTEIRYIESGTEYGPAPYGQFAGEPTVSVKLSSSDQNALNINSLENMFSQRGWKKKIKSGHARLRIYGDNPFHERHEESLEFLFDVLDPRFIDIEVKDLNIETVPSNFYRKPD